jgi:hypothetical protein
MYSQEAATNSSPEPVTELLRLEEKDLGKMSVTS